jgi:hypothetical protein
MLSTVWKVVHRIWRGAWQPTYLLPREGRWWRYVDYFGWRAQDIVGALYIFVGPPWIVFMIYEKFTSHPKPAMVLTAIMGTLWLILVALAYRKGRKTTN